MDYYIDLTLQPDEEFPIFFIRNKVFSKFHKVLFELKIQDIGVSFPKMKKKLGNIIRLHGQQKVLQKIQDKNWLGGLSGYCHITDILLIPKDIKGYKVISRIRQNSSNTKLQRLIKRQDITNKETEDYKIKIIKDSLKQPYLELKSQSTKQDYRIYICSSGLLKKPTKGEYNYFGLSKTATVPWF